MEMQQLIGAWLSDYHREDIEYFRDGEFGKYEKIAKGIRQGLSSWEIAKGAADARNIADLIGDFRPIWYESVLRKVLEEKSIRELQKAIDSKLSPEQILGIAEGYKTKISALGGDEITHTKLDAEGFMEELEAREKAEMISWGIPALDRPTYGIHRKQLTTIAARPSQGKSTLGLQVAKSVSEKGQKVLFFNLEMTTAEMVERLIVFDSIATSEEMKTGRMGAGIKKQIRSKVEALRESETLKFYESKGHISTMERIIGKEKPFLVVIDQLRQVEISQRYQTEREKLSHVTAELKRLAMKHNTAIVLLHQINRAGADDATLENLKGSGSIEEDSDNVFIINKAPDSERGNTIQYMRLDIAKQRNGATGSIPLALLFSRFKFVGTMKD